MMTDEAKVDFFCVFRCFHKYVSRKYVSIIPFICCQSGSRSLSTFPPTGYTGPSGPVWDQGGRTPVQWTGRQDCSAHIHRTTFCASLAQFDVIQLSHENPGQDDTKLNHFVCYAAGVDAELSLELVQ